MCTYKINRGTKIHYKDKQRDIESSAGHALQVTAPLQTMNRPEKRIKQRGKKRKLEQNAFLIERKLQVMACSCYLRREFGEKVGPFHISDHI